MKRISEDIRRLIRLDRETLGLTIYQLSKKYGHSKSSVHTIIYGCDNSKVLHASPKRRVVEQVTPMLRPNLSKGDLGEAARQIICARLMLSGVKVFRPMSEDTPTDLLVLRKDGTVLKCQCKYIYPCSRGNHVMNLFSTRKSGPNSQAIRHRYTTDEVDYFLGYCGDNDGVYVISNRETNGVNQLAFWILREPHGSNGLVSLDMKKRLGMFEQLK
jgi:hypothetical protein